MIKTEYDLLKLTTRQREVLIALVRQLSKTEVARLSHVAARTTKFDTAALLHVVEVVGSAVQTKSAAA